MSSHYRYGVLCSLQPLNHDDPRYQLDSPIALQIPFAYQPFLKFHANLLPMARWVHRAPRLGFLVFLRLVSLTRHPKADYRGVSTFSRSAKPTSGPILATFPRLPKIVLKRHYFVIRKPSNGRLQAFPIAAKSPTLAVTLISCMKLIDVFRFAQSTLLQQAGLSSLSAELHMPAQTKMPEMPSKCFMNHHRAGLV